MAPHEIDEIEELFQKKKTTNKKDSSKPAKDKDAADLFADTRGGVCLQNYKIYTEEELGLDGKGGDTAECPFDCSCCF